MYCQIHTVHAWGAVSDEFSFFFLTEISSRLTVRRFILVTMPRSRVGELKYSEPYYPDSLNETVSRPWTENPLHPRFDAQSSFINDIVAPQKG